MELQQLNQQKLTTIANFRNNPAVFARDVYKINVVGKFEGSKYFPVFCVLLDKDTTQLNNEIYIVRKFHTQPFAFHSFVPSTPLNELDNYQDELQLCGLPPTQGDLSYFGSDEFTNGTLIHYLLWDWTRKTGIDTIRDIGIGFMCNGVSHQLIQQVGNITELSMDTKTVESILTQLVVTLHSIGTKYRFNWGNGSVENVYYINKPARFTYKNVVVDSDFTIKIDDFRKASMSYHTGTTTVRLYNNVDNISKRIWTMTPFRPIVGLIENQTYYIADDPTLYQHMGFPFYTSFDLYTVLVSFMMIPGVLEHIDNNIIDTLFFTDDRNQVVQRIRENIGESDYNTALSIINGIKLKCMALDMILLIL